jgi:hypothetical protein
MKKEILNNFKTLLFGAGMVLVVNSINAQTQKGLDIDGEAADNSSGRSVCMPDRNTIAIGAQFNFGSGSFSGSVRIYNWNGSAWEQKGGDIDGEATFDLSGYSLSMPNANTIAIGATGNDGSVSDAGHVRIYAWNGTSWVQKGSDIDGEGVLDQSGCAVSMPDTNTIAIGASSNSSGNGIYAGHVRIYKWNGSSWVQKGSDIDGEIAEDASGYSVSMPDSNTVAIGAPYSDADGSLTDAGHVRVYTWNGFSWMQKGADIDGEIIGDQSGWSVSMPDTNTVAIGAPYSDGNGSEPDAGQVRVYLWNGSSWVQKGSDIDGQVNADYFGTSVSMPDANTLAIGAPDNNGHGRVQIYTWNPVTNGWVQKGINIDAEAADDRAGWSVCMPDTNTVAIGAPQNDGNGNEAGQARVYSFCSATTATDIVSACDSYMWIDGNTYTSSNNFATYILTNGAGCDSVVTLNLTINTVDVSVTNNTPTLTANQSGANYQWIDCNNGNTAINGETSASFTATVNGSYAAVVSINGCTDTTACVTVNNVGIVEGDFGADVVIYPNPTSGDVKIHVPVTMEIASLIIRNVLGQTIYSAAVNEENTKTVTITGETGIYFIELTNKNGERAVVKVVKK